METIDRTTTNWGTQADKLNANFDEVQRVDDTKKINAILISGASFADSDESNFPNNGLGNTWFEKSCKFLGVTAINKAESGTDIVEMANAMYAGTQWSAAEFEQFEVLALMYTHDYDVADETLLETDYTDYSMPFDTGSLTPLMFAHAYDYVLKKYAAECYAKKDDATSQWYNTKEGKPFKVAITTHWHDGRSTYNDAIRTLRDKWGFTLIKLDENIGFSKNQLHPITGLQWSELYCNNGLSDTEVTASGTFGWHPTRGESEIQEMLANIFTAGMHPLISDIYIEVV